MLTRVASAKSSSWSFAPPVEGIGHDADSRALRAAGRQRRHQRLSPLRCSSWTSPRSARSTESGRPAAGRAARPAPAARPARQQQAEMRTDSPPRHRARRRCSNRSTGQRFSGSSKPSGGRPASASKGASSTPKTAQQAGQPHHGADPHRPAVSPARRCGLAAAAEVSVSVTRGMIALLAQNIMASRHAVWPNPGLDLCPVALERSRDREVGGCRFCLRGRPGLRLRSDGGDPRLPTQGPRGSRDRARHDLSTRAACGDQRSRAWALPGRDLRLADERERQHHSHGQTVDTNASFIDLMQKSDSLIGFMPISRPTRGRSASMADFVFTKMASPPAGGLSQSDRGPEAQRHGQRRAHDADVSHGGGRRL